MDGSETGDANVELEKEQIEAERRAIEQQRRAEADLVASRRMAEEQRAVREALASTERTIEAPPERAREGAEATDSGETPKGQRDARRQLESARLRPDEVAALRGETAKGVGCDVHESTEAVRNQARPEGRRDTQRQLESARLRPDELAALRREGTGEDVRGMRESHEDVRGGDRQEAQRHVRRQLESARLRPDEVAALRRDGRGDVEPGVYEPVEAVWGEDRSEAPRGARRQLESARLRPDEVAALPRDDAEIVDRGATEAAEGPARAEAKEGDRAERRLPTRSDGITDARFGDAVSEGSRGSGRKGLDDTNELRNDGHLDRKKELDRLLGERRVEFLPEHTSWVRIEDVLSPARDGAGWSEKTEAFWNHHGNDEETYREFAERYPEIRQRLRDGATPDELKHDEHLGHAAEFWLGDSDPLRLVEFEGSHFIDSGGYHRVVLAKEHGFEELPAVVIPARRRA